MRVPAVLYGDREQILQMDDKVYAQLYNVTLLPGLAGPVYAMPDAHWGYGFPIGGVAAFDADEGGVVSAGGVGFDISCGGRTLHTGLRPQDIEPPIRTGCPTAPSAASRSGLSGPNARVAPLRWTWSSRATPSTTWVSTLQMLCETS